MRAPRKPLILHSRLRAAALAFLAAGTGTRAQLAVLPLPRSLASTPGCLRLAEGFAITAAGGGGGSSDSLLAGAMARASSVVATAGARGESVLPAACAAPADGSLAALRVGVASPRSAPFPAAGDDESYALHLSGAGGATLEAQTVWGAMRGLETFTQLVSAAAAGASVAQLFVPAATVDVNDEPRWTHRGLMLDTGRAFLPVSVINASLDAMSYLKLNVLHWHISDDQAFPLSSSTWPNLTMGAMQAPATSHVYSAADVRGVVLAAQARGIRVVPELDVPGHATSWFFGYPSLRTDCELPPTSEFSKPMDPTRDGTYSFLGALFDELHGVFPDELFHVGGDEVEMTCWANSSSVAAFMAAHGIATFPLLQLYFEQRVAALLRGDRRAVVWEANSGNASAYPASAVVEVWKERHGDNSVLEALARQGFTLLYTTPDWYLDYPTLSVGYDYHINGDAQWQFVHSVDPLANTTLSPAQQALLLGGEVAMWSPYEDATNVLPTIFPRAAAVAERLWSAAGPAVDEPGALLARMRAVRCRLVARGIAAAPVALGDSCPNPFTPVYVPPFPL